MELRNLRALVEVVRRTTFLGAAKELFATQSAVSKAVKQLEDELGMLLLERNGRNSRLTDAGEIVYKRATAILTETKDLVTELSELRDLNRGKLRFGLPSMGGILFAKSFALFRKQYPNIEVRRVRFVGFSETWRIVIRCSFVVKELPWTSTELRGIYLNTICADL